MAQQFNAPNLFNLSGDNVQITYSTSGIDGKPHFNYEGPFGLQTSQGFTGPEIRTEESELGTLVSVTLVPSVDAGATILTLLLPPVRLEGETAQPLESVAIITQTFGILPHKGAQPTYQAVSLQGSAQLVIF